jgi:HEAT repeat protein
VEDQFGQTERFFEWVDPDRNVLLKLLSQDRDWFVEYSHVVLSPQPEYYFNPPLGYRMIEAQEAIINVVTKKIRCLLMGALCLWTFSVGIVWADDPSDDVMAQAQKAFEEKKFQEVVDGLKPIIQKAPVPMQATRLYLLALASMGKAPAAMDSYEKLVQSTKREDESLLRQIAIAIILSKRADMREQIRGAVYTAINEIDSDEMIGYLEEGLTDGSGMIRALAAEALGKRKAGQRSKPLREALKDSAGLVRATAVKSIGKSGDKKVIPLLEKSLQDEQALVQIAAARALFELGQKQLWSRLEQGAKSEEGYERGGAIRAFGELKDFRAFPLLEKAARDKQPSIRAAAIGSLGKLQAPESLPILKSALFDPVPGVRNKAAFSMKYYESHQVLSPLSKALLDTDPGVQAAASASLLHVGVPFSMVEGTLQKLLQDQNPALRSIAVKALSNGKGGKVIVTLKLMLNDPIPRPRIVAVRSLGRIGEHELLPILKRTLRDTDDAVQVTAGAAIVRILDGRIGI